MVTQVQIKEWRRLALEASQDLYAWVDSTVFGRGDLRVELVGLDADNLAEVYLVARQAVLELSSAVLKGHADLNDQRVKWWGELAMRTAPGEFRASGTVIENQYGPVAEVKGEHRQASRLARFLAVAPDAVRELCAAARTQLPQPG